MKLYNGNVLFPVTLTDRRVISASGI